jgi:hypothetical protein
MLAVVRVIGVAVRHDHLGERDAPEYLVARQVCSLKFCRRTHDESTYRSHVATVVERNIGQYDTLSVVEANVEVPFLPIDSAAIQLEGHAFRLGDMDRLEVISEANLLLNEFMIEVGGRCCVERSALLRDVNVNDLLCLNVEDGAEVERVGVLQIIDAGSVIHDSLLKSGTVGITFVITYRESA